MEADEYYYWCFICKKECLVIEADDGELQCERCLSSFVEEIPNKKFYYNNEIKTKAERTDVSIKYENNFYENRNNLLDIKNNYHESNEILNNSIADNNSFSNSNNRESNSGNSNLIEINVNNSSNRDIHPQNDFDDPRNFQPILNTNNNIRTNNGVSSISFSNQEGNALIQMQISGLENNPDSNNFNTGISNFINSIFSSISGNPTSNIVNISNNRVSLNLTGLLGNHANSLIQGLQNIDLNGILGRNINDNAFENILNIVMRSNNGNPPASEQEINNLERIQINDDNLEKYNTESCIICADDYMKTQKIIRLSCSHFFHDECIITWLRKRNQCPVCRKELKTDDEDYEKRRTENRSILNNLMRSNSNNNGNDDGNGDINVG